MRRVLCYVFTVATVFLIIFSLLLNASAVIILIHDNGSEQYYPDYYNQMYGDLSGDMEITAEDARLALRLAVGLFDEDLLVPVRELRDGRITVTKDSYDISSRALESADVNGDQEITAEDARLILRAAVGLENIDAYGTFAEEAAAFADYDDDGEFEYIEIDCHYTPDMIVDGITLTYFDENEPVDSLSIDNTKFPAFPVFASDLDGYHPGYFEYISNDTGKICVSCNILIDAVFSNYFVFSVENGKLKQEAHLLDPGYTSGTALYYYDDYGKENMESLALYGKGDFNQTYGKYDSYLAALEGELVQYGFRWEQTKSVFERTICYALESIQVADGYTYPVCISNRSTDGGLCFDDIHSLFYKANYISSCWVQSTIGTEIDLDDSFIDVETNDQFYYQVTDGKYKSVDEIQTALHEVFTDSICNSFLDDLHTNYRMVDDRLYGLNTGVSTSPTSLNCLIVPLSESEYELQFTLNDNNDSLGNDDDPEYLGNISLILKDGEWKFDDYLAFYFDGIVFFQDA